MHERFSWYIDNNRFLSEDFTREIISYAKEAENAEVTIRDIVLRNKPDIGNPAAPVTAARDFGLLRSDELSDSSVLYDSGFYSFGSLALELISKRNVSKSEDIPVKPLVILAKVFNRMRNLGIDPTSRFLTTCECYEYLSVIDTYDDITDQKVRDIVSQRVYSNGKSIPEKRIPKMKNEVCLSEYFNALTTSPLFECGEQKSIIKPNEKYWEVINYIADYGVNISSSPTVNSRSNDELSTYYSYLSNVNNGIMEIIPTPPFKKYPRKSLTKAVYEYLFGVSRGYGINWNEYFSSDVFGLYRIFYPIQEIVFAKLFLSSIELGEQLNDYYHQTLDYYSDSLEEGKLVVKTPFLNGHNDIANLQENEAPKMSTEEIAAIVSAAETFDYSSEYEYFRDTYSVEALSALSEIDLAVRLFASSDYAKQNGVPRGYAVWAEHGRENPHTNPFGKAKSHTGGQGGVSLKSDGTYHIYEYSFIEDPVTGKKKKKCVEKVIDADEAAFLAAMILDAFSRIIKYIHENTFVEKADYERLLVYVKEVLLSTEEPRLYWNEDGDPDGIVLKYLHCSCPDVFACCYSKDRLKQLLIPALPESELADNSLVLNGQLSLLCMALPVEIDNANFGVIWWRYIFSPNEEIAEVDDIDEQALENERSFRAWMALQTTAQGSRCTASTISNNCMALNSVFNLMDIIEYPDIKTMFEVTNIDDFCSIRSIIKSHDDYDYVNKTCRNGYLSSGLKWYEKYLNECFENVYDEPEEECDAYSKEAFLSDVFMEPERYDDLVKLLKHKKNIILQGAPGVGKTFLAKRLAYSIIGKKSKKQVESIQFHQSYGYEDFIMGYKPNDEGFELKNGVFYQFCKKAETDGNNDYFFIIDEINRGNLSRIFGELMMLIEGDKRGIDNAIKLAYKDELFSVPANLYIIGMMNTADRSLAMMDYALRRRFCFFDVEPAFNNTGFTKKVEEITGSAAIAKKVNKKMKALNDKISDEETSGLGKGFCIGHSYFCVPLVANQTPDEWYKAIIMYEIAPLLDEYWWDDKNKANDCKEELLND